jgi:pimeloyl-ACP methyl ester carboxylesterase
MCALLRLSPAVTCFLFCVTAFCQQVNYPYPVQQVNLPMDNTVAAMAYMDIKPAISPNGKTVVLLHGKNFNGYYWKEVIPFLTQKGYRVIVPDQVGWGRSAKPAIHYSFHLLAQHGETA